MNGGRPSKCKLVKSMLSLNHTLALQKSLASLVEKRGITEERAMQDNERDVEIIYQFLKRSVGVEDVRRVQDADFQPNTCYHHAETVPTMENPLEILNNAYTNVSDWVDRYAAEAINVVQDEELEYAEDDDENED